MLLYYVVVMNMKLVLIIDAPPMFREFLKEKLTEENIRVETSQGNRDAFTKMLSLLPDLVILDIENSVDDMSEFLEKKSKDINAAKIPIIISGPRIELESAGDLVKYGMLKYFTKPIKFDVFFESIGRVLKAAFLMDTTPCLLELHMNGNLIFIEISAGLNREKIAILKYKLTELIDANALNAPKIILMMSNLKLSFIDMTNLEFLFDTVTSDRRIQKKDVKILSLDSFVKEFIKGHENYSGIKVSESLLDIANSFITTGYATDIYDAISEKILSSTDKRYEGSVEIKFRSDSMNVQSQFPEEDSKKSKKSKASDTKLLRIALVDDNYKVRKFIESALSELDAECAHFDRGSDFEATINSGNYDLVILDIFIPGLSGFGILEALRTKKKSLPVIVYSKVNKKDDVSQAMNLGAKKYLEKPQSANKILSAVKEILGDKINAILNKKAGGILKKDNAQTNDKLIKVAFVNSSYKIRKFLESAISELNAKCSHFSKGFDFNASAKVETYDLVFLDITIPDFSGFEILTNLRNKEKSAQIPVIVYTDSASKEDMEKAASLGVKNYLVRPQTANVILSTAKEILHDKISGILNAKVKEMLQAQNPEPEIEELQAQNWN